MSDKYRPDTQSEQQRPPLVWQQQEPLFDHPDSCCYFRLDGSKPVGMTRHAAVEFTRKEVIGVLELLQREAEKHHGIDYLQTFKSDDGRRLWVIEDGEAITALLPSDY